MEGDITHHIIAHSMGRCFPRPAAYHLDEAIGFLAAAIMNDEIASVHHHSHTHIKNNERAPPEAFPLSMVRVFVGGRGSNVVGAMSRRKASGG